ncbi:MAG: HTTM domain-containing protein [Chthoniobacterales bacterium]
MRRLETFLFPAKSTRWLALLRVGLGLEVLIYSFGIAHDWKDLFLSGDRNGASREIAEAILNVSSPFVPRFGWLTLLASRTGIPEAAILQLTWLLLVAAGLLLVVGLFTRGAAVTAWLLHLSAVSSGGLTAYGVDIFTTIGLFYLAMGPLPDAYSADALLRARAGAAPQLVGFFQRVLQVHLCLIYFFGGLAKCLGRGWWDGTSLWRALTRPPFDLVPTDLVARWSALLLPAGIAVLVLETLYPVFIWPRATRKIWLWLVIGMHVGIGAAMGLRLFAFVMIVLNVAAFGEDLIPWSLPGRGKALFATRQNVGPASPV